MKQEEIFSDNASTEAIENQNICLDDLKLTLLDQYIPDMYLNHHRSIYDNLKDVDKLFHKTRNFFNDTKLKLVQDPLFKLFFYYCP
jgi:hypothetical protein